MNNKLTAARASEDAHRAQGEGKVEPVAWLIEWNDPTYRGERTVSFDKCHEDDGTCTPLYAAPAEQQAGARCVTDAQLETIKQAAAWHRKMNRDLGTMSEDDRASELFRVPHGKVADALESFAAHCEARNASGVERGVAKDVEKDAPVAWQFRYRWSSGWSDWIECSESSAKDYSSLHNYEVRELCVAAAIEQQKALGETAIQFAPQKTVRDVLLALAGKWREEVDGNHGWCSLDVALAVRACADELEAALGENSRG